MKAIICTDYGSPDVLQLKEVDKPVPSDNEVLIKIHATEATVGDCEIRRFQVPILFWLTLRLVIGLRKPHRKPILGMYLSGEIESVGEKVNKFIVGDKVFGSSGFVFGAYAEYVCIPETAALAIKPDKMTYQEAAATPIGGLNALHFLRKANIQSEQRILINGAGGSIGCYAVQLAKSFGAQVTGVDKSSKLDVLRSIGADHVIDYTQQNFTQNGETYDVIFDVIGTSPYSDCLKSLSANGCYILASPSLPTMLRGLWTSITGSKKVIFEFAEENSQDLITLKQLIDKGSVKSVIDRIFPLEQLAEAHRYIETGQKKGSVVITMVKQVRSQ